ncbi:MAG TPA: hypothetical protein VIC25_09195 [Caulobacteraceae bacterium]
MSLAIVMAAALAAAAPDETTPAPAPAAITQATAGLVTSYPAAFFAPAQPSTALDMVGRVPGFSLDVGGGVRGFGAAGNVLIDGVRPPAKGDSLDQILSRIPASSVLRIDLIRAGAPGVDMQGKTVLADVIRRKDIGGKATLTLTGTHAYDGRVSGQFHFDAEKRIGQVDLQGSLLILRALDDGAGNGSWNRVFGNGARIQALETSQGHENNYKATGALEAPVLGGSLKIDASVLADPYHNVQRDRLIPPPGEDFDHFFTRQDTAEIGVRFERPLGAKWSLETYLLQQLGRQHTTDDFISDPVTAALTGDDVDDHFALHKTTGESIARALVRYAPTRTLSLQAGVEGDFNWLKTHTTFVQNGMPVALPAADVKVTEARGEAFATAVWQARPNVSVEAGLRMEASRIASSGDVISARTLSYPKPRLLLSWSPDAADQLRVRIEREIGQLNFDDFTAQTAGLNTGTVHAGNPNLNPTQDWVFEAAWDRRFWNGGDLTVTVRHYAYQQVEDRIGVVDPSGIVFDAPGDIGAGTEDEAVAALTLPTDRLGLKNGQLTGQATIRRSRVIDPTTGQPREFSALHPSDWELHFNQGLPRWRASWGFDIAGQWRNRAYRFNEIDATKIGSEMNLWAEYKPKADVTLRVDLLNATARGVETSRQVFNGPRDVFPLDFTDVRRLGVGRFVRLTLIKAFG